MLDACIEPQARFAAFSADRWAGTDLYYESIDMEDVIRRRSGVWVGCSAADCQQRHRLR
jgi:hypothetical protein